MKNAILFDLDGTLLNTLTDISESMNHALKTFGLPVHEEEKYKLFTGDGAVNLTKRSIGDRQDMLEQVYRLYRETYEQNSRVHTAPYPGIVSALKALHEKGYKLLVLSNKDDTDAKEVVKYYLPEISFTSVQGKIENMPVKPDPALAFKMLGELGIAPKELWYVGDTATDMRCARNIGAACIAVTWGFQTRDMLAAESPNYFADKPEDLPEIILTNN